jgi:glycosyltransferase involved in cell wall biosynthesis
MSLLAQETAEANIECVVVDDCSPDSSMNIVNQIISDYEGSIQFKVLTHDKNRGLSAARNTGLKHAAGDYIYFVDSDDYLMPNSLQYFLDNLKVYPDVDIVMGNAKNCKSGDLLIHHIQETLLIDDPNMFFQLMLRHQIYLYAWNKLIRRDFLVKHQLLFEEGIIYEDQCWSYELFSHVSSVLLLPKVTYVYENNPMSIVNTSFTPERSDLVLKSYAISISKILDMPPVPGKYKTNMTVDYLLFMMYHMMNGVDVLLRCPVSETTACYFMNVRKRLFARSIKYGRLIVSIFYLLLFPPFCYVQKFRVFRHHYYDIETIINRVSHFTDFLHHK